MWTVMDSLSISFTGLLEIIIILLHLLVRDLLLPLPRNRSDFCRACRWRTAVYKTRERLSRCWRKWRGLALQRLWFTDKLRETKMRLEIPQIVHSPDRGPNTKTRLNSHRWNVYITMRSWMLLSINKSAKGISMYGTRYIP